MLSGACKKVWGTAPTHVATDNFADRFVKIDASVVARANIGLEGDDEQRFRHKVAVRAYKPEVESRAFLHLLQFPDDGDKAAATKGEFVVQPRWKVRLSAASLLLSVLRSPIVPPLHPDAGKDLHKFQAELEARADLSRLRAIVTQEMSWPDYRSGEMVKPKTISALLSQVLSMADIIFSTPALAAQKDMKPFHDDSLGTAVDEAANMNMPDFLSVWGTGLRPCLMAGDDKQLPPTVITDNEKDAAGNTINRFAENGRLSVLLLLKGHGWPVYRLRTQLRMADDLFDMVHEYVYKDVPIVYGPMCTIDHPTHADGVKLEAYLREAFPDIKAPRQSTLQAIFVHCEGTQTFKDQGSTSKKNPSQCRVALDLVADLVENAKIHPSKLVIITPYKANVALLTHELQKNQAYRSL